MELTHNELIKVFFYNPETGLFTRRRLNRVVETKLRSGHIQLTYKKKKYAAHRVAWFYMTGSWPQGDIDHKDRDPSNNRFENLRECSRKENCQNRNKAGSNNLIGLLGVSKESDSWLARITVNGKSKRIGLFATPEEAHEAYLKEKDRIHSFYKE